MRSQIVRLRRQPWPICATRTIILTMVREGGNGSKPKRVISEISKLTRISRVHRIAERVVVHRSHTVAETHGKWSRFDSITLLEQVVYFQQTHYMVGRRNGFIRNRSSNGQTDNKNNIVLLSTTVINEFESIYQW